MSKPPPLPAKVLARVLRVAGIDGWTLVAIAGGFGLISASAADWLGAGVGGLAAGAGLLELHGRRRLRACDIAGVAWLVRSQFLLLAVILGYVAYQYFKYDPLPLLAKIEPLFNDAIKARGLEPVSMAEALGFEHQKQFESFIKIAVRAGYAAVGVASVLCQGGLAFYYHRKREKIASALHKS